MLHENQEVAKKQLKRLEKFSRGAIEIVSLENPGGGPWLKVIIRLYCGHIEKKPGGLPLKNWEIFEIFIDDDFPLSPPRVYVPHQRFHGFPHVQWTNYLCLYLSLETEWDFDDGIYGFVDRLEKWLIAGASGNFEEAGQPLHPPVTYNQTNNASTIVVQADTPKVDTGNWLGHAVIERINRDRIDLTAWQKAPSSDNWMAPAILFDQEFPFEYPGTISELVDQFIKNGISIEDLYHHFLQLMMRNAENNPNRNLYLIVGTPMRGKKGDNKKQHLSMWQLDENNIRKIANEDEAAQSYLKSSTNDDKLKCLFPDLSAALTWCRVMENRPEIVVRRDASTSANKYKGLSVAIWGCGALGSHIAEAITRAGVSRIILRDHKLVTPGILVRQNFEDKDIGIHKSIALKDKLLKINPNLKIEAYTSDIVRDLKNIEELKASADNEFDLVIDVSASRQIKYALEKIHKNSRIPCALASMTINSRADMMKVHFIPDLSRFSLHGVSRQIQIDVYLDKNLKAFEEEFWPDKLPEYMFQPEPGCSDPTFSGSAIDMMSLTSKGLDQLSAIMDEKNTSCSFFVDDGCRPDKENFIRKEPDKVIKMHGGSITEENYQARFSQDAIKKMNEIIVNSPSNNGIISETGGILFGKIDENLKTIWIDFIGKPPEDSKLGASKFICGIDGTETQENAFSKNTKGAIGYVGMWHTHPGNRALPSATDIAAVKKIVEKSDSIIENGVICIIGSPENGREIGLYLFSSDSVNGAKNSPRWQDFFTYIGMDKEKNK